MAGIYIHIPFCKQACYYCDFYFSTLLKYQTEVVDAICSEIKKRAKELNGEEIKTIYFGGGTPSILEKNNLQNIVDIIQDDFDLSSLKEFTLEANPDDLSTDKLLFLKSLGVNRLSIGLQSFDDSVLKKFNRSHNSEEATACITRAKEIGFESISVDLIYGIEGRSLDSFKNDVNQITELGVDHISAYHLTIEEGTVFGKKHQKGEIKIMPEENSFEEFQFLISALKNKGYHQYEISNFALDTREALHNTSYWFGEKYLGVGPAAHSFNGKNERRWNVSNNHQYVKSINQNSADYFEIEKLSDVDVYNEKLLTRLRTKWGVNLKEFSEKEERFCLSKAESFIQSEDLILEEDVLKLTDKGKTIVDYITGELFM